MRPSPRGSGAAPIRTAQSAQRTTHQPVGQSWKPDLEKVETSSRLPRLLSKNGASHPADKADKNRGAEHARAGEHSSAVFSGERMIMEAKENELFHACPDFFLLRVRKRLTECVRRKGDAKQIVRDTSFGCEHD